MEFQSTHPSGVKIGPYPDNSYILVNLDGSLFIERVENGEIVWIPLESSGDWLVETGKRYRGRPTDDYINIKYRKLVDIHIGYVDDKVLRLNTVYANSEILMSLNENIKYNNGKYICK